MQDRADTDSESKKRIKLAKKKEKKDIKKPREIIKHDSVDTKHEFLTFKNAEEVPEDTLLKGDKMEWEAYYCPGPFEESEVKNDLDTIEDINGKELTKKKVYKAISLFKKDSRNFWLGDSQNNCSRMNRRYDDRWYLWTKEMMENVDRNETIMKDVLKKHSHEKIQQLCSDLGGDEWNLKTSRKIKKMLVGIDTICKGLDKGMRTYWGKFKFNGVLDHRVREFERKMNEESDEKKEYDIGHYCNYKSKEWKEYFEKQKDKEDSSKLYKKY